jgi:hypothetical protein
MRISNNISILRKQFKVTDYELIRNAFDIERSAGSMDTHHYEALLGCVPTEQQVLFSLLPPSLSSSLPPFLSTSLPPFHYEALLGYVPTEQQVILLSLPP